MSSNLDPHETQHMVFRPHDPNVPIVKVTKEIPLPWLLGVIGIVLTFGIGSYYTQLRQGEQLTDVLKKLDVIVAAQDTSKQAIQDLKYELRDTQRRVTTLETGKVTP